MHKEQSSNLFLLELLFAIFFFIIVSTICLQVFAKAHSLNEETLEMNKALELVQNEVEYFYIDQSYSNGVKNIYYDNNWNNVIDYADATFLLENKYSVEGDFTYLTSSLISLNDSNTIYSLTVKVYNKESE